MTTNTWTGMVVGVVNTPPRHEVVIQAASGVHSFPFRAQSDHARVFQSMQSLGQHVFVFEKSTGTKFGFLASQLKCVKSLIEESDGWRVNTSDPSANYYFLPNTHKYSEAILSKLQQSLDLQNACWFVAKEQLLYESCLNTGIPCDPRFELLNVIEVNGPELSNDRPIAQRDCNQSQRQPIEVGDAHKLFQEMQNESTNPTSGPLDKIPFLYPENGCVERCHAMADFILNRNVCPIKVWVSGCLEFSTVNHPCGRISWSLHTAPAVHTKKGLWVIDPAISMDAEPVDTWQQKFSRAVPTSRIMTSHLVYSYTDNGRVETDPFFVATNRGLAFYRNALRLRTEEYGAPPFKLP